MNTDVFDIVLPKGPSVPILVSVPHCGTSFPDEIKGEYVPELMTAPDDTDWFVDQLYDFVPDLGITMISARYSRWVIDLNRDPDSKPLYDDGRAITQLTPDKSFAGEHLYLRSTPDQAEIERRKALYYWPYHHKVGGILNELKQEHGQALLFDCHSIRRRVPSIYEHPFPDLILGDNDERSADAKLIQIAWGILQNSPFQALHNTLFKGGQITRSFGKPQTGIHALQLEMSKDLYMDDVEKQYDSERANYMRQTLEKLMKALIDDM